MASGDLTSVANVKGWLSIKTSTTEEDALIARLVTAVSSAAQTWINRKIASQAYTETRDGNGKTTMSFANYPVTAVSGVVIDGVSIPASASVLENGYYFNEIAVGLRGYVFSRGQSNIQIQYTAGYSATPPEIEQAVIETVALRYSERSRIGHASKSLAGETVAFTIVDFPRSAMTILQNYKKVIPL